MIQDKPGQVGLNLLFSMAESIFIPTASGYVVRASLLHLRGSVLSNWDKVIWSDFVDLVMSRDVPGGKLSTDDRMRMLANLMIDRILEDYKNGHLKFTDKAHILN